MAHSVIITIVNQKGGVGKTTTAVNLGHYLALKNYRTLLVDLDSQGNVSDCLGLEEGEDLYYFLSPDSTKPLEEVITPSGRPNLDVIRSNKRTLPLETTLNGMDFREYILANAFEELDYDVIVIDCPPGVRLLQTMAIVAAQHMIIPTELEQLSSKGVAAVIQSYKSIMAGSRSSCRLSGVLPTFYERVTKETHEQLDNLVGNLQDLVLPPIPKDVKCKEAVRFGKTLWEYAPKSHAITGIPEGKKKFLGGYSQACQRIEQLL